MAETFNPYADWLGVRSAAAQPNHYELLRLAPFESDPDAILTAANMQMAKVRSVRPAEHVDDWRRLLDELGAAKHCLTDFVEKSQYDAALRAQGWPGPTPNSGPPSTDVPAAGAKRSPYMEVTDAAMSNPLPPQFGAGRIASSPSSSAIGGNTANASSNASPWQPGTNLLPPGPRVNPDAAAANQGNTGASPQPSAQPYAGAAANGWIPPQTSEKAWTPPSPNAAQPPAAPFVPNAPVQPQAAGMLPSPPAPKPKLQFPGETVPMEPAPSPPAPVASPPAPIAPSPAPGFPAPAPGFPAGMPQQGGAFNQFPRPFAPMPMPGVAPQGGMPPNAMPPNAMPQQPMPQQPFAGPFFPGGPTYPGVNPQFQQFAPGTPGMPNYFPHPQAAPNPYAQMPMQPPGGMPGYYPQPGAMPGFAGNYPPQGMPPQGMMPQGMMPQMPQGMAPQAFAPQPMAPQPMAPQEASPAAGGNFLDDVLSGPSRGGASPMDELGFGDAAPSPQQAGGWQSGNFPQPANASADPVGFEQAPPPPFQQVEYDSSSTDTTQRPHRTASPPQQGSNTMLIGGALGAVALLAAVLVVVILQRPKEPTVVVNEPAVNGSHDPSPQHPAVTKLPVSAKLPAHDKPTSKNPGSSKQPGTSPATKPPAETPPTDPSGTMPKPEQPSPKTPANPGDKPPPATLVIQPTTPDPAKPKPAKPVAIDPVKAARLNHLLVDIRRKLGERDQENAKRLLDEATPLAVSPEQTDRVQRMSALVRYVGEFWGAVHDAMEGLKPTDEIDVGSTKVVVVEKDAQSLTIHLGGGNKHFTLREMPSGFAVALANRWLDPNKPENKIFVGSFYAVDPKSDPDDAKRLWGEASAAGVSDGAYLLPLLNPEPPAADMAGGGTDSLPPVPEIKDIDRVTLKVKEEFDEAIVAATTPTKLGDLIQRFFDTAESSDDPVRRYVLYVEARDMAVKAGRAKLTIDAVDRIAKEFRVDALDMKADTFANYPPTTAAGGREVMHAAMALVEEAIAAKRMALASRFAQAAVVAAQVSGGDALKKQAMQRSKEVEALASKKMASDPK